MQVSNGARYTFTSKELDKEAGVGWHYFGARYYDAGIGRWLTPDPHADSYPDMTPYHYCHNNPLEMIDPTGMDDENSQENQNLWRKFIGLFKKNKGADSQSSTGSTVSSAALGIVGAGEVAIGVGSRQSTSLFGQGWRRGVSGNYLLKGRNLSLFGKQGMTASTMPITRFGRVGQGLRMTGGALTAIGLGLETVQLAKGEISVPRYSYHVGTTGLSVLSASAYGGPAGLAVGGLAFGGEIVYDNLIVPARDEVTKLSNKGQLFNRLSSSIFGTFPFKFGL